MPSINRQTPSATNRPVPIRTARSSKVEADGWPAESGLKVLVYGRSGTGKTTFWSSFPKPILVLLCSGGKSPGELRSIDTPEFRKVVTPRVVRTIEEVKAQLADGDSFATTVLDHASGLQDLVLKNILGIDELPAQKGWGLATQQQYGQCTLQCKEVLRTLLSFSGNVVIVAQERSFGEEGTSDLLLPSVGAALTPSLTGWLNQAVDYIGNTFIRPKVVKKQIKVGTTTSEIEERVKGQVEYCLRTAPDPVYTTKFRVPKGRVLPDVIVDPDYEKMRVVIRGE